MKKTSLIVLVILVVAFSAGLLASYANAAGSATDLIYKPNIPIPQTVCNADGSGCINFAEATSIRGGDFLAKYIVAIYSYGAGFAGIVAMFMLVIAGWRWLMAAGNAQKISSAKDMVTGVLIGLALLFGGQLLLRQISEDFGSVKSLSVTLPADVLATISDSQAQANFCAERKDPKDPNSDLKIKECKNYLTEANCRDDICSLITPTNFNKRCMPKLNKDLTFDECKECPNNCNCDYYKTAEYRNMDICDCDDDGAWPDIDGCDGSREGIN